MKLAPAHLLYFSWSVINSNNSDVHSARSFLGMSYALTSIRPLVCRILRATRSCVAIPRAGWVLTWLILLIVAALASRQAHAEERFTSAIRDYQIAEQSLSKALTAYAEQSDLQIFYRSGVVSPLTATELRGRYTPQQALEQLLTGTNLGYTFGEGAVVIRPLSATDQARGAERSQEEFTPQIEELYITGIRSSLKLNLAIKRSASTLVDLVTAEDIGKFPDRNIADSLQRIPGVSVDRLWGEGRDVNIRGTHKDINRTLLNGQHVASAYWWANDNLGRGFNYSTLASQLVQSLEVHKSPSADLDEGSIGGTVIVRTRKPLNLQRFETHIALEQQYNDLRGMWDPQASLLSNWKNEQSTFGILASLNWQTQRTRRDGLETFPDNALYPITDSNGATTADVYSIWGGGSAIFLQDRTHNTGNVTLQWAPAKSWAKHWDGTLNLLRSDMDIANTNHNFLFVPGGYKLREEPPARVENPVFFVTDDGHRMLAGGTLANADSTGAVLDHIQRDAYIRTAVNDLELNYQRRSWDLHLQAGNTGAAGGTERDRLYRFLGDTRVRFALEPETVDVDYLDIDPLQAEDMAVFSAESRDWIRRMETHEDYGQFDLTKTTSASVISAVKMGGKYRDHHVENRRIVGAIDTGHPLWQELQATGLDQVSAGLTPILNERTSTAGSLRRYAWTDAQRIETVIDPLYRQGLMRYADDTGAYYQIDEKIAAFYTRFDLDWNRWSGNAGLRRVITEQTIQVFSDQQRVQLQNDYRDYLPSVNLSYRLLPDLILRGAAAKVMARPSFQNLSPNLAIDPTSGSGSMGNPYLEPYRANQYDFGFEWYFAEASLLSATFFQKRISTFVYPETQHETVGDRALYVTRPRNTPGADIGGVELQWQHDFANGFGVLSNYTYTDATVPSPEAGREVNLPGNSQDQLNASIYYEGERLSARLSYNYRSRSFGELISGSQAETAAYQQWDASAQWQIDDTFSVSLKGVNLNNEVIYIRNASGIPQGFY